MTDLLSEPALAETPLAALHARLGARMVGFAGWSMPVSYPDGTLAEHRRCREAAALFDVSHMGQASLAGAGADLALERLVPGDIAGLKPFRQRYTLLLNDAGGIVDDLMVARLPDRLFLVVNASRAAIDLPTIEAGLPAGVSLVRHGGRGLLALQGPLAAAVMARLAPEAAALPFMGVALCAVASIPGCWVSRSGYTGEDGFEISVPGEDAAALAERLLAEPEVGAAGLAARDSLRLEAGLCLYGSDLDETTTPVEADLAWTLARRRREAADFPGASIILAQLADGPQRLRIGLRPEGRAPARAGAEILAADGETLGTITSGGFSPTLGAPVAMGYARAGRPPAEVLLRGKKIPARVEKMPFVPHRYRR